MSPYIIKCPFGTKSLLMVTTELTRTFHITSHPLGPPPRVCCFKLSEQNISRAIYTFQEIIWKEITCPDNKKGSLHFCIEKNQTKRTKEDLIKVFI
jgi:hypothetical protein